MSELDDRLTALETQNRELQHTVRCLNERLDEVDHAAADRSQRNADRIDQWRQWGSLALAIIAAGFLWSEMDKDSRAKRAGELAPGIILALVAGGGAVAPHLKRPPAP